MSTITPNILELAGAFFLGGVVTVATLWTLVGIAAAEHGDDDDTDDDEPLEEKPA